MVSGIEAVRSGIVAEAVEGARQAVIVGDGEQAVDRRRHGSERGPVGQVRGPLDDVCQFRDPCEISAQTAGDDYAVHYRALLRHYLDRDRIAGAASLTIAHGVAERVVVVV